MTEKEQRYIENRLVCSDQTEAARKAGYRNPMVEAVRLEKRPHVKAALDLQRQERAERVKVDADWVLSELVENVKNAKADSEYGHVNRGLELVGKTQGLFEDVIRIRGLIEPFLAKLKDIIRRHCTDEQTAAIAEEIGRIGK